MDLFNIKGKKVEKLVEEKRKLQQKLDYVEKKKPRLVNNTKKKENFLGTTNCEICTKRTSFDIMLRPNESAHVLCNECEEELEASRTRIRQIDYELKVLEAGQSQSKPKTLTLNNKNNKRR